MKQSKTAKAIKLPIILLVILVLFSGTILGFSSGGFVLNFQQIGFSLVSSLQKVVSTVVSNVTGAFTAIKELATLKAEYENLTKQLENYEYLQRDNAEVRKENQRLKELLGLTQTFTYESISAQILNRDPNALYSSITINKGSKNGIKKNMPVIAIQNGNIGLVGKIITVGPFTSQIMPVYDFNFNVSTKIQTTRDIGLITGGGDSELPLNLKYIKKRVLDELQYGDIVVTSGENDNYMRDIPIGTISGIKVLDYDTSLEIDITPIIDFSRLEYLLIVNQIQEKEN
jgi:rod shape-determining protein MreC